RSWLDGQMWSACVGLIDAWNPENIPDTALLSSDTDVDMGKIADVPVPIRIIKLDVVPQESPLVVSTLINPNPPEILSNTLIPLPQGPLVPLPRVGGGFIR